MKISFAMIWDLLNVKYPHLETPVYDGHEVRGVKLLPVEGDIESNCLYLGLCPEGLKLCCGGKSDVLKTESAPEVLFNELQDIFNRLRDWDMKTHLALIEGCEPQRLLEISEDIMGNPMTLMDPSYKLLAITSHEEISSSIFNEVRRRGYLPAKTVEFYRLKGYMDAIIKSGEETACISENACVSVVYPLRVNGSVAGFLTMPCINRAYSRGLAECFRYLAEGMMLCMERQLHTSDIDRYMYEYLLMDILNGKLPGEEALAERLRYIDLPSRGEFALLLVEAGEDYASMGSYLSRRVSELLPGDRVFLYKERILVLLWKRRLAPALESLRPFLEAKGFSCGVSLDFAHLMELPTAYSQAKAAIRLGRRRAEYRTLEKLGAAQCSYEHTVYHYRELMVFHMAETAADKGLISPYLIKLVETDRREGSDHLRVLHAFLACERRPTQTAAFLHMHRNNVIYRIDRIESILGVSVGDGLIRRELEFSFTALELTEIGSFQQNAQ